MSTTDHETSLLRKTVKTALLMLGACVLFVGTLSVLAVVLIDRPAKTEVSSSAGSPVLGGKDKVQGAPGAIPGAAATARAGVPADAPPKMPAHIKPSQVL